MQLGFTISGGLYMKDKNIVVKSIAFNADDPDQLTMLEHAKKRSNFSSYIKRLIQRDLEGGYSPQNKETPINQGFDDIDATSFI